MKHNWEVCRIGHFCDVKTGKLDANASCENGLYPFFTCSKDALRINSFSYNCECVLIAGNGDLNVKYYNGKFDAYQRTYIITVKPKFEDIISVEYLYNFFRLYISTLREKSVGGIIKFIKLGDITNAVINVPSLKVQKIIVSELNKINDTIEDCRELLRNLDALAQSLFYDFFGDPITNTKGWPLYKLSSISQLINGRAYKQNELLDEGKYKVIRVGNFFTNSDYYYSDLELSPEKYIDYGDLIFAWSASFGAFIWQGDKVIYHYHIWKILFDDNLLNKIFYKFLLNEMTSSFMKDLHGIGMMHLTKAGMENYMLPVPPLSLQEQFAARIEQIEEQKKSVEQTIAELQTLLDSRMDYWFN